jgi:RHS repeat-associated protein
MPVAMVDSTGTSPVLYFIHTDQLGTPQKITDGSMNVVWDGVFDPFGNPASGASLTLTNLRFPGQYFDAEVSLSQNWNRDYDPTNGRYAQSDPIGLTSGPNTYAYVDGNPLNRIDPSGTQQTLTLCFGGPISCAAGVALTGATIWAMSPLGQKASRNAGKALARGLCPEPDECEREWEDAREMCRREFSKPNPSRAITGGYRDVESCARGHVSERCGGNPVDYGKGARYFDKLMRRDRILKGYGREE